MVTHMGSGGYILFCYSTEIPKNLFYGGGVNLPKAAKNPLKKILSKLSPILVFSSTNNEIFYSG